MRTPPEAVPRGQKKWLYFYHDGAGIDRMRRGAGLRVRPWIAVT